MLTVGSVEPSVAETLGCSSPPPVLGRLEPPPVDSGTGSSSGSRGVETNASVDGARPMVMLLGCVGATLLSDVEPLLTPVLSVPPV